LPEVERVITNINDYEDLWRDGWESIAKAIESFESGSSQVKEFTENDLSLVTLAPQIFSGSGFNPTRHAAPYTGISRYARGKLFVIAIPKQWWLVLSHRLPVLRVGRNRRKAARSKA
jgi:hypothetical protein